MSITKERNLPDGGVKGNGTACECKDEPGGTNNTRKETEYFHATEKTLLGKPQVRVVGLNVVATEGTISKKKKGDEALSRVT